MLKVFLICGDKSWFKTDNLTHNYYIYLYDTS